MSLMAIPHPRARFPLDEPLARFVVTIAREGGRDGEGEGRTSNFSPSNRGEVCIEPGSKMRNCLSITRGGGRGIIDDAEKSTRNPIRCNLAGN